MRTFYIFKVKREYSILTKDTPYNLYHLIENLYYNSDMSLTLSLNEELFLPFDTTTLNKLIKESFNDNRFYKYEDNKHFIYNKYLPEESVLKVYKSHLVLKSNLKRASILNSLKNIDDIFVCDFLNKTYYWLNEFVR